MKKQHDLLGVFLAATTGIALLTALLLKTFLPRIILPNFDSAAIVVLSLSALLLDYYICRGIRRNFLLIPIYAVLIFGLFPFAACFVAPIDAIKLGVLGAVVFTVITYLFDTMTERLSTSPATKIAPIISVFVLFLAAQCLVGII